MAQYAVLIYAGDSVHAPGSAPEDEDLAVCDNHSEELADSDVMVAAFALTPRDMAKSVRNGTVTDGPFLGSKEIVTGFYVIEAPDLDSALAIAGANPAAWDYGAVEVRPLHSSFIADGGRPSA